jgi:conjugative relaxase-like TrwC/TraI family protein
VTVSLRRMSAGNGYKYLLRSVAAGDGNRALSTPLTRYYSETGTPPGRWMGAGLQAFGKGQITPDSVVTEDQLALLIGLGCDPITGDQLGRAYPSYARIADRIQDRVDALNPEMTLDDCASGTTRIEAEETTAGSRRAVAGFDLTFSVPKSVSVFWGVADGATQERIVRAHHDAVAAVLGYFEREVAATRTGVSDRDGAVAQVDVAGVAAVAYDHYDSRAGDPQLHTHLVVSNKVSTVWDQRWRSLDSRPVHAAMTGLSAHYNAVLADQLSRDLGIEWELRARGPDRNPQWEVAGVSDEMLREFSSRSREIDCEKDRLILAYRESHGRMPSEKKIVELRAQATLATRPPKEIRSLADLTAEWRTRVGKLVRGAAELWAASLPARSTGQPLTAADVSLTTVRALAAGVVDAVSVKRSTWSHWNLLAEASKQTMDLRFASTTDREAVVGMIVDAAEQDSVSLTPPELAMSPAAFRRADDTSVFRPRHSVKFSSQAVLDAEARLLDHSSASGGPTTSALIVDRVAHRASGLSAQQRAAIESIATSGRQLDLLVGPAGAGKTTTMRALRHVWLAEHGQGSVIGLAPSANAAQTLAEDLGIECDNTSKWLFEHNRGNPRYELHAGQLVIVDEATLSGTMSLDQLCGLAAEAGAKLLLVGDAYQLSAVDAGGAFSLLADRRPHAPELTEIHRFTQAWEKTASLALRRGDAEVISAYAGQNRIEEGSTDAMLDMAYERWRADQFKGCTSILVTESTEAVKALNQRARAERVVREGAVDGREIKLADGSRASVGDLVITRRNDRALRTMQGHWVKNGDRWRITDIRKNGSVVVRRLDTRRQGSAVLPFVYVAEHVDLGYAITAHRAQGITVDTAHVVVTSSTTRENLYVSMTRGRDTNIAYVALDQPDDSHSTPEVEDVSARTVLYGVLQHTGASKSAHQTIEEEHSAYVGIDRLAAELETIAADAQHDHFVDLLRRSGLSEAQHKAVADSTALGPLIAALRRAEANHHDLERLVPRVVAQHGLADADDIAAVLTYRIDKVASSAPRGKRGVKPRLIAGLIPEPLGPMTDENRQAIDERKHLIDARARACAEEAVENRAAWTRRLGPPPAGTLDREAWITIVTTVAAYRDRYGIVSDLPVGGRATNDAQETERRRALRSVRAAAGLRAPAGRARQCLELSTVSGP